MEERRALISQDNTLTRATKCELLQMNRSTFYYRSIGPDPDGEELKIRRLMDELHMKYPFMGSRSLRDQLQRLGYTVNRKRVQRLMKEMNIHSTAPKPNTSRRRKQHKIYPYLLRGLQIYRPNQVWAADITYIPMSRGFLYLVAIMDWYSRKVLSWRLSNSLDSVFCVDALQEAIIKYGKPDIFNTDQGSQFTGEDFTGVLKDSDIRISMDGKGRWMDNVFIERLWRSLKYEEVYLKAYDRVSEAKTGISQWLQFYNQDRTHQSLGRLTPNQVYFRKEPMKILVA
jgi:putative transposase